MGLLLHAEVNTPAKNISILSNTLRGWQHYGVKVEAREGIDQSRFEWNFIDGSLPSGEDFSPFPGQTNG